MFKIVNDLVERHDLASGAYDLLDFVPDKRDPSLTAGISPYTKDMSSADYPTRALVFGNESARISGKVVVNQDGAKTFKGIEIRPLDTDFNFAPKDGGRLLEEARAAARKIRDPENQSASYDIRYRGPGPDGGVGRIYDPFTDSQLNAALHKRFVYPNSGPPWLLPSITGKSPLPLGPEYGQYLDQTSGNKAQTSTLPAAAPAAQFGLPAGQNANDIGKWIASLAGVDRMYPGQAAPQPADRLRGIVSNQPMPDWPFPPPIFNTR